MDCELRYVIFVKTTLDIEGLVASLKGELIGISSDKTLRTFVWSGNWVQVWTFSDEGHKFRYMFEIYPIDKNNSVDRQISIARHLKTILESFGCAAFIRRRIRPSRPFGERS